MAKQYNSCLVAIGSNLMVDKLSSLDIVKCAIVNLSACGVTVLALSRYYRTPSFPKNSGPDFVNAAILIRTERNAADLLQLFHDVEQSLGRVRDKRWGARVVDIDLLSHGNQILPNTEIYNHWKNLPLEEQMRLTPQELILPHPRIQDRGFVLGPLMDIAPNWSHSVTGKRVSQMWSELSEEARSEISEI